MTENVFHAFKLPAFQWLHFGNTGFAAEDVDHFRHREHAHGDDDERDAVPEITDAESETLDAGTRISADERDGHADSGADQAAHRLLSPEDGDRRQTEQTHHQEFRRAEAEHQRLEERQRDNEGQRPDKGADQRAEEGRTESTVGLAHLRQWIAVKNCGLRTRTAGHADQHRGEGIRGIADGGGTKDQSDESEGIQRHRIGHRGGFGLRHHLQHVFGDDARRRAAEAEARRLVLGLPRRNRPSVVPDWPALTASPWLSSAAIATGRRSAVA